MSGNDKILFQRKHLLSFRNYLMLIALILPFFILQGCATGPRLVVDTNSYDFGKINQGDIKKGIFNLSNKGDKTLVIQEIEKCCGAVIKIDKNEIPPGQSTLLTAEYHASQGAGLFSRNITVHTNDPQNLQKTLTIKGTVIQTLEWSPTNFSVATYQHTDIPDIIIRSLNNKPFSIRKITSTNQSITADFDPDVKATEFTLKPKADMEKIKTIEADNGDISIQLDHPDYAVISLSFQLIKPLQVSPSQIVVTRASKGEPIEKTLEIHDNAAPADENIFEQIKLIISSKGANVEMLKHENLGNTCKIDLKITPSEDEIKQAQSTLRDEVVIKMSDGRQLNIPVRIYYE